MAIRYFPLVASAAFLAADSFPVSATYQVASLQMFQAEQPSDTKSKVIEPNLPQLIAKNSLLINQLNRSRNLLESLDLDFEQQQQIRQIRYRYQKAISQQRQQLQTAQQKLATMITGEDPVEVIRVQYQDVLELRQQLQELQFESLLATREVLTPLQRQKFAHIMESQQNKSSEN